MPNWIDEEIDRQYRLALLDATDRDRRAAENFARACGEAGVRRVVYLGGLVPSQAPPSPHLASRLDVERILLGAVPAGVALRASIVVGAVDSTISSANTAPATSHQRSGDARMLQ